MHEKDKESTSFADSGWIRLLNLGKSCVSVCYGYNWTARRLEVKANCNKEMMLVGKNTFTYFTTCMYKDV